MVSKCQGLLTGPTNQKIFQNPQTGDDGVKNFVGLHSFGPTGCSNGGMMMVSKCQGLLAEPTNEKNFQNPQLEISNTLQMAFLKHSFGPTGRSNGAMGCRWYENVRDCRPDPQMRNFFETHNWESLKTHKWHSFPLFWTYRTF